MKDILEMVEKEIMGVKYLRYFLTFLLLPFSLIFSIFIFLGDLCNLINEKVNDVLFKFLLWVATKSRSKRRKTNENKPMADR